MSTSATRRTASPSARPHTPAPAPQIRSQPSTRLYRVIWRWHFYAGVIVAPVLIVMAATGALYIFKDEIEQALYAKQMFVEPSAQRVPLEQQLDAAQAAMPPGFRVTQFEVAPEADRATVIYLTNDKAYERMFVDPYRGTALGQAGSDAFFRIVLQIHRTLFAGTPGRIVVELVTCWTIVLLVTGTYLWWPRSRTKVWGAWLPRLRRHPYLALRDLHAVSGVYAALVALLIACTGLIYTYVWGQGYQLAALKTGAYEVFYNPPQSRSPAETARLPLDQITAVAAKAMPGCTVGTTIPRDPRGAFVVFGTRPIGPSSDGVVIVDHATGEVLQQRTTSQYKALGWWASWNYPLHVGSVLGLWTKVPWLVARLVLMLLPVTGVWMWWHRRPKGRSGFPRKPEVRVPRWLVGVILLLAAVLPALGLSIVAILLGDAAFAKWRQKWSGASG
jgi:uncharacterized iron-regulated membrane protein